MALRRTRPRVRRSSRPNARFSRIEKAVFLVTVGLGVLLLVALPMRWRLLELNPSFNVPATPQPSPNALDFFVQAGSSMSDHQELLYAVRKESKGMRFPVRLDSGKVLKHKHTLQEKRALLSRNQEVLRLFRQGLKYEYQHPLSEDSNSSSLNSTQFYSIPQYLTLEGQVLEANGDWEGAANSYVDAIHLAVLQRRGGDYHALLSAASFDSIATRALPDIIVHLKPAEAKRVARRIEGINALRPTLQATLEAQKQRQQRILMEAFARPDWRDSLNAHLQNYRFEDAESLGQRRLERLRLEFLSKRDVFSSHTNAMDDLIAKSGKPFRGPAPRSTPAPEDPVLSKVFPFSTHVLFGHFHSETRANLLIVGFMLQAFKKETGKYPASLNELTPRYFKSVPRDPFSENEALRYKLARQLYILYSIGPDGKDDGGVPATSPGNIGGVRNYVVPESVGDIVLGTNY